MTFEDLAVRKQHRARLIEQREEIEAHLDQVNQYLMPFKHSNEDGMLNLHYLMRKLQMLEMIQSPVSSLCSSPNSQRSIRTVSP